MTRETLPIVSVADGKADVDGLVVVKYQMKNVRLRDESSCRLLLFVVLRWWLWCCRTVLTVVTLLFALQVSVNYLWVLSYTLRKAW